MSTVSSPKVAILGDFDPRMATHQALNASIAHCLPQVAVPLSCDWIGTADFEPEAVFAGPYAGLWVAPGSPYQDMDNVLRALRYTREQQVPTLGTCGGFQHMLLEYARSVCGLVDADHEETNPAAADLVIAKLTCSLTGEEEQLRISDPDSLLYRLLQQSVVRGRYVCSYGLSPRFVDQLAAHGCAFTAFTAQHEVRAFELPTHPFYLGTLFQPALTSTPAHPDPLIVGFLRQVGQPNS